jgi:uncharacterized protein
MFRNLLVLSIMMALAAVAGRSVAAPALAGPSFDCARARSPIETAICADPELAKRDRTLTALYRASLADALVRHASPELSLQRKWLAARDAKCAAEPNHACLARSYDFRLADLAVAALFQAPDLALAELRRQDARRADLYEAVWRFATLDDEDARTRAVEPVIRPVFQALKGQPWSGPLQDVSTARDIAASETDFATLIDVAGATEDYGITFPCTAILKRPGLIFALSGLYGNTLDGALGQSNCESVLPPLPKLDALEKAWSEAWDVAHPDQTGSIRFLGFRDHARAVTAVRTHVLPAFDVPSAVDARRIGVPAFRAAHRELVQAARTELTLYYTEAFKLGPATAHRDAELGVAAVLGDRCPYCIGP